MLRRIKQMIDSAFKRMAEKRVLSALSDEDRELIERIREKRLTYLSCRKIVSIASSVRAIESSKLSGIFIEAGCALGGSSILIASLKSDERSFNVYDVFEMIPPPTEEDTQDVHDRYQTILKGESQGIGGDKYYGYEENLYDLVQANLKSFSIDCEKQSVSLVKGLVQDTMNIDKPVAFAHVDVDWFEPVMTCLTRVFPRLVSGGCIILDDYHDWGGCRKATDEYLKGVPGQYTLDDSAGSMKITRV